MRKVLAMILLAVVLTPVVVIGVWLLFLDGSPSYADAHFTVTEIKAQPFFSGDSIIINATVVNDEPEQEIVTPSTTEATLVDEKTGDTTVTAIPTTIVEMVPVKGGHMVTAELLGPSGHLVRSTGVVLSSGEVERLSFDFGPVAAGDYTVTVTAPSYNDSRMSRAVSVNQTPLLGEWTVIGDVAFRLINLKNDGVDVEIRNDGGHAVTFGSSQYAIYVNCNGGYSTALRGLEKTVVTSGQAATVHAIIPISGEYFLDNVTIKSPDKSALVTVPVNVSMSAAP